MSNVLVEALELPHAHHVVLIEVEMIEHILSLICSKSARMRDKSRDMTSFPVYNIVQSCTIRFLDSPKLSGQHFNRLSFVQHSQVLVGILLKQLLYFRSETQLCVTSLNPVYQYHRV